VGVLIPEGDEEVEEEEWVFWREETSRASFQMSQ
jgi:hypothetical protein